MIAAAIVMPMRLLLLLAYAALAACQGERDPRPTASPAAAEASTVAAAPIPAARPRPAAPAPQASATPKRFAVPTSFTALGTEPFWAAKVDGAQLTYQTPEDQAGHPIAVTRMGGERSVELRGTLDGMALRLTIGEGPCSDGMSDMVYPFAATLRLGEDTRRGCARRN